VDTAIKIEEVTFCLLFEKSKKYALLTDKPQEGQNQENQLKVYWLWQKTG